jgi:GalNAc-alpha-(1->4)-GalNAc-alpha-(1->3)-diNAcBac-PP-undecaprenol alpha-1,4-N-acetyl-D-galactosaminyltransferase
MKIGFKIRKMSFGGGERIQQMLMNEFAKLGHEIILFTYENVITNINVFPFQIVLLKRQGNFVFQFFYEFFSIMKELRNKKLDCLIMFGLVESFICSTFFTDTTSIVSLRVDPRLFKNQFFIKLRYKFCFILSTGVVFQTEKIQHYFSKKIQLKSIVIPNPIIDDFLLSPKALRNHRIVSIGRLSSEKNYAMLIKSFSNICQSDYTLHIYGEGPLKQDLELLIEDCGMKNRIILEGNVDRVVDEISDAEIFITCSDFEGMPNALIEAMAMGLACISTNFPSGAAEKLIINYENGILIPVGDQQQLEKSIELLINDKRLSHKIRENAPKLREVLKRDTIINQWINYIVLIKD